MKEQRPNPDLLLQQVTEQEIKSQRGHLRLFFGMAAGVGKTYAMLRAAHERKAEGVDVWVGVVETHERVETKKLTENLPDIPKKKIEYRDTVLEEMDLDAILQKRPQLVLVDELAHSNAPGSRHEKRFQDVREILDAGIDVYSTMNVQHLESRADIVGLITATKIRETVPDSVFDMVDQIDLIDLTPAQLLARLKEGKIYPGRKTEQALQYFFQEGNLSALREIALRVTANKVERDSSIPDEQLGKLLVLVNQSAFAERLVRSSRRIVESNHMLWTVAHVDTGKILSVSEQARLMKTLNLAEELGAQTVTLHGHNIADVVSEYIREHQVRQVLLGRSRFAQQIITKNPQVDITLLQEPSDTAPQQKPAQVKQVIKWSHYSIAFGAVVATSMINALINPYIGYRAVGFIFQLLVIIASVFLSFPAVLLVAASSALIWNYFFIPPIGTFAITALEDMMMFVAYFVIACVGGFLTSRVKQNQNILREREAKTRAMYEIVRSMNSSPNAKIFVEFALDKISELFHAECCIVLAKERRLESEVGFGKLRLSDNDMAVAVWSYNHSQPAGWSTDTLPLSPVLCLILQAGEEKLGVLVFKPQVYLKLNPDQETLLSSVMSQIATYLAKQQYESEHRAASLTQESEKLHQTLLNCISHELRTPLTAVMGAASTLQVQVANSDNKSIKVLSEEIVTAADKLNHLFENLLDATRLETGSVKLKEEWFDLAEVVESAVEQHKKQLISHMLFRKFPEKPLYFYGDFDLLSHAFANLLLNAASYSPQGSSITVKIEKLANELCISISDQGKGVSKNYLPHLFDKFYRSPGTPTGGLGLGLSISKNLIDLHRGRIEVNNNPDRGATFTVVLPHREAPKKLQEL